MAHCHRTVTFAPRIGRREVGIHEERRESPTMSLASHLEELERKHGDLEREISEAMAHPSFDDLEIARLKRRKLAIKDEIVRLKEHPTRH
jgi:hypothetical protein